MKAVSTLGMIVLTAFLALTSGCQNKKGPLNASGLNRIHFELDSSSIGSSMVKVMDGNAAYLKKHKNLKVVIEGHCDERGTNEYNIALGEGRASSAESYLVSKGISDSRLKTVSYGEEKPLDRGHNESAWYLNRRAEFTKQ